ncbi:MAG: hypothetical protein J5845_01330 [Lachnospiraceae bacterium]|nr:hypothetical protein [Lachnospiraceae bacterium]
MDRRKNRGSAVVAVIVVLALIGIGVGAFFFFQSRKYDPGTLENGTYTNKWAKVKITAPEGYSAETKTEGGYKFHYFIKGSNALGIGTTDTDTDVDGGIEEVKKALGSVNYAGVGVTVKDPTTQMIAGEKYKCVKIEMSAGNVRMYINIYARKVHGNGVIAFFAMGTTPSEIDSLIYHIQRY